MFRSFQLPLTSAPRGILLNESLSVLLLQLSSAVINLLWVFHEQENDIFVIILRCPREEGVEFGARDGGDVEDPVLSCALVGGRWICDELRRRGRVKRSAERACGVRPEQRRKLCILAGRGETVYLGG